MRAAIVSRSRLASWLTEKLANWKTGKLESWQAKSMKGWQAKRLDGRPKGVLSVAEWPRGAKEAIFGP